MRAPSEPVGSGSADLEELARNVARILEEGGKALAAYLKQEYAEMKEMLGDLGLLA